MNTLKQIAAGYNRISLIGRIAAGIVIGVILALVIPQAEWIGIFGDMFVGALKAIAPVLVAILVMRCARERESWTGGSALLSSITCFLHFLRQQWRLLRASCFRRRSFLQRMWENRQPPADCRRCWEDC